MRSSAVLAAAAALTFAVAQDAPITQNNPTMATVQANLQADKDVQGTITGVSTMNGTGVNFNVNFYSFPSTGGPFSYYIASSAVPSSNDCSSLTKPFNPYSAATSKCDATDPSSCAVGALSAKHGSISPPTGDYSFQKFYLDLYLSTASGTEAYFGGLSIVIADKSGKPLNCASFAASGTGAGSSSSSAASSTVASATSSMSLSMASATSSMSSAMASASSAASSASASAASATSSAAAVPQGVVGSGAALIAAIAAFVV